MRERYSRSGDNAKMKPFTFARNEDDLTETPERLPEQNFTSGRRRRRKIAWCLSSQKIGKGGGNPMYTLNKTQQL